MLLVLPGLLVALVNAVILYKFWNRKITWWEVVIPAILAVVIGVGSKLTAQLVKTTDVEYHGGWGVASCHQEPWTEWREVHVDDYCTRTVPDGKGKTKTESYKCGSHIETKYTNHSELWWLEDSNGQSIATNKDDYQNLSQGVWKNKSREDGHHGDYHRVKFGFNYGGDGYLYKTKWPDTEETLVPTTTAHNYTNKVQAAEQSLFHFRTVDKEDIKNYGLYEFPGIHDYYRMQYLHGCDGGREADLASQKLEIWNAKLGRQKQVQMRVLVFVDKPLEAAMGQEAYWQGGNKNEFIVCVGLNEKNQEVRWAYVISWTEEEKLKIQVRDFARSMKKFDPVSLVDFMAQAIQKDFVRKSFADFAYLKVVTPTWAYWVSFILCVLATIGIDVWVVKNSYDNLS